MVTGYDDRYGCGYVLRTGRDAAAGAGVHIVSHAGVSVVATTELAAMLRDALAHNPVALLTWSGPEVPLTLDDQTVLVWLRHTVGGVLTVTGGSGPNPRVTR
ncbi:MAG: hypothetical protein ACRDRH_03500 [Pseudonocardia sp.]